MRSLTLGVSPLPALALLLALLSPLSAHAQGGGFGLGPAQGAGGGSGTAGSSYTADPFILDDGAGNVTYLSQGSSDGQLLVGQTSGQPDSGVVATTSFNSVNSDGSQIRAQLLNDGLNLRSSAGVDWTGSTTDATAASTLRIERDGAAGALKVYDPSASAASAISLHNAAGTFDAWLSIGASGAIDVGTSKGAADGIIRATYHDSASGSMILRSAGTTALTLDASQDATFAGDISNSSGNWTIDSAGNLILQSGGFSRFTLASSITTHVQQTWATGLGAITHLLGPSDQAFQIRAAAGRALGLYSNDSTSTGFTINTTQIIANDPTSFEGNAVRGPSRVVEANTAVAASPNTLNTTADNWTVFSNEGTTAENHHDLPTAAAGLTYTFVVQDSDGIQINVATGDSIRIAGSTCTTGTGNVESATVGDTITLVAINATEWVAVHYVGTWTLN